ncbi:post-GPI attachment to proteins factor 4-like [Watersipora subatra]|uniref:post-GPI attachment to proteins factor 4-like n=1 Tax=Watersipora subatra TaxID=2589382 RepID=UPI00355B70A4
MSLQLVRGITLFARKHFIFFLIIIVTFGVVLPLLLRENRHSLYSRWLANNLNSSRKLKLYRDENDVRYRVEQLYLKNLTDRRLNLISWENNTRIKLLVAIVTTSRMLHGSGYHQAYKPYYLTQVVSRYAKIKKNRSTGQATDIAIVLCDVDANKHTEAASLASIVEVLHIPVLHGEHLNKFELEKRDYGNCLNYSLGRQADYILLAEDDALPHHDLLDKLDHLFMDRLPRMRAPFGYIKLFHPSRLNGFITPNVNRILEWFALAGLLEHITTALLYVSQLNKDTAWTTRLPRLVYFILLLLAVGRINVLSLRSISPYLYRLVWAPNCCTPALIFTPSSGKLIVNYLNNVTCEEHFAKDSALDLFTSATGLRNWFFEPKLFTHIGVYTTRRNSVVDPDIVD